MADLRKRTPFDNEGYDLNPPLYQPQNLPQSYPTLSSSPQTPLIPVLSDYQPNITRGLGWANFWSHFCLWASLLALGTLLLLLGLGVIGAKEKLCLECLNSLNNGTLDLTNFTLNANNSTFNLTNSTFYASHSNFTWDDSILQYNNSTAYYNQTDLYFTDGQWFLDNITVQGQNVSMNLTDFLLNITNGLVNINESLFNYYNSQFFYNETIWDIVNSVINYQNSTIYHNQTDLYFVDGNWFLNNITMQGQNVSMNLTDFLLNITNGQINITDSILTYLNDQLFYDQTFWEILNSSLFYGNNTFVYEQNDFFYDNNTIIYNNTLVQFDQSVNVWNDSQLFWYNSSLSIQQGSKVEINTDQSTDICGSGGLNVSSLNGCDGNDIPVGTGLVVSGDSSFAGTLDVDGKIFARTGIDACPTPTTSRFSTFRHCLNGNPLLFGDSVTLLPGTQLITPQLSVTGTSNFQGLATFEMGLSACPAPTTSRLSRLRACVNGEQVTLDDDLIVTAGNAISVPELHIKSELTVPFSSRLQQDVARAYINPGGFGGGAVTVITPAGMASPAYPPIGIGHTVYNDSFVDSSSVVNFLGPFIFTAPSRNYAMRVDIYLDDTGGVPFDCSGYIIYFWNGAPIFQDTTVWWGIGRTTMHAYHVIPFSAPGFFVEWAAALDIRAGCPVLLGVHSVSVEIVPV